MLSMIGDIFNAINRLLRYERSPVAATAAFKDLKHNKDLLPRLQNQLEAVLNAHGKFEPLVYDTQGILDDGSDVVIRYGLRGRDEAPKLIGFQVKSFNDLQKKSYMQELKAQRDDTFRKVQGIEHYYIVACTDASEHKDKVRNIAAEFRSAHLTDVIEPEYAFGFMNHPLTRVEALVKRLNQADDIVYRQALDTVDFSVATVKALAVYLITRATISGRLEFTYNDLIASSSLRRCYQQLGESGTREDIGANQYEDENDHFERRVARDLDLLNAQLVSFDGDERAGVVQLRTSVAVMALATDALARYEYSQDQLIAYMFNLLDVLG